MTQLALKSTKFGEITQNNGHYVVQGHSRSPISVPIQSESPYATYYYWIVNNTNLHPISHRFQVMVQYESNFPPSSGVPLLTYYFSVISDNITVSHVLPKTRYLLAYIYVGTSCMTEFAFSQCVLLWCQVEMQLTWPCDWHNHIDLTDFLNFQIMSWKHSSLHD